MQIPIAGVNAQVDAWLNGGWLVQEINANVNFWWAVVTCQP